ncbi:MAG: bifunctional nuclease family protein [Candidatus Planktophila sp.]|nr:bifunctional nuclease family protein [Candidatus Planktophila sp.]
MFIPVEVVGVRIEMPSNQPIVLLKEIEGSRFLPIWVGAVEATSIAFAQQGLAAPRPLTHDLIRDVLERVDITLASVHITAIVDGVFFAELNLRNDQGVLPALSARPSDAIAIALRTKSNILVDNDLFDQVGIDIPEQVASEVSAAGDQELEAFREFLEQINPEDFAG